MRAVAAVLLACLGGSACSTTDNLCSVAVRVQSVRDARTSALICDASVVITDASGYRDNAFLTEAPSGEPPTICSYTGAADRPGSYTITISKPGYTTLQIANVVETKCGVEPSPIDVKLQADP